MKFIVHCFLIFLLPQVLLAQTSIDLGDLQIPAARIADFDPGVTGGIPDTTAWPQINALDYGATPNDASDDTSAINTAINAASAQGNTVVYLPEGTYRYSHGTAVFLRSNAVLRGAGPSKTIITGIRGRNPDNSGLIFMGDFSGSPINITSSSLPKGSSVLTLADASSISPGDWIHMAQDNDPSYIQAPAPNSPDKKYMSHVFKVVSKTGNSITMSRPLLHAFGTSFNPVVTKMNPIENAGIEDLKIMFDLETGGNNGRTTVLMEITVNCWAKNIFFYNGYKNHISFKFSARNTVTGSKFERLAKYEDTGSSSSTYSIQFEEAAVDNLVANNISLNLTNIAVFQRGPSGNVYSYNYHGGTVQHKGILFHGQYPHHNLVEGVVSEYAPFQIGDNFWGQSGPGNTAFRNRLKHNSWYMVHVGGSDPINQDFNVLLNSGYSFHRKPFCDYEGRGNCGDIDEMTSGMWLERNISTDTRADDSLNGEGSFGFILKSPQSTTTLVETTHEGPKAPASWQGLQFPASLYLSGPPEFWCEELPWPAVGADVDDHSGTLAKVPAQIWAEGGTCTPIGQE